MFDVTTPACPLCKKNSNVKLTEEEYSSLLQGEMVQNALYSRDDDFRELVITGTHSKCWDLIFPDDDED